MAASDAALPPGEAVAGLTPAGPLAGTAAAVPGLQRPPLIPSEALLRGHKSVEISHQGVLYRLQATRQGKLILTK